MFPPIQIDVTLPPPIHPSICRYCRSFHHSMLHVRLQFTISRHSVHGSLQTCQCCQCWPQSHVVGVVGFETALIEWADTAVDGVTSSDPFRASEISHSVRGRRHRDAISGEGCHSPVHKHTSTTYHGALSVKLVGRPRNEVRRGSPVGVKPYSAPANSQLRQRRRWQPVGVPNTSNALMSAIRPYDTMGGSIARP